MCLLYFQLGSKKAEPESAGFRPKFPLAQRGIIATAVQFDAARLFHLRLQDRHHSLRQRR
ncbi:hypothetical protein OJJOAM_005045 [Cupriavidus sp. H18C1]